MRYAWFLAELIGTFTLIFVGAGSIIANKLTGGAVGVTGIALAHGLAIGVMVTGLGHISGGKFNPAITFGLALGSKVPPLRALLEVAAQLIGAVLGAVALNSVYPLSASEAVTLGTPNLASGVEFWQGIIAEAIVTFFLVFTVFTMAVDRRNLNVASLAGLMIGLSIVFGILAIGGITGAALNPARAFGPALISGSWTNQIVYWVGPLLGGAMAAGIYTYLLGERTSRHSLSSKPGFRP